MKKTESLFEDLKQANRQLEKALKAKKSDLSRDAAIQRFEFTFELAWKFIQAYIRQEGLDCRSPRGCLREAGRAGLFSEPEDVQRWFDFLDHRNLVAHTYNQELAERVYDKAGEFFQEVVRLIDKLS